jgi:hypothetical protein
MSDLDDIHRRLRISKLQAKRELLEIECAALMREIASPLTSQDRREEAVARRTKLSEQCTEITEELKLQKIEV